MPVSRIDLADFGSPDRLVMAILKAEPDLSIPVPVEQLAKQLGITEVREMESDGFIGGLITDASKSKGVILVQQNMNRGRRRFTIGHELGHLLIPTHTPGEDDRFLCSLADLAELNPKVADRRKRWEAEANRFSSLLLVPPTRFRKDANATRDPDLQEIVRLARRYDVSKEVMGRAYVDYRDEPAAFVLTHNDRIIRYHMRRNDFPFIAPRWGAPVPSGSLLRRKSHDFAVASAIEETNAAEWFDLTRGEKAPTLYEQVYKQQNGYALILLSVEPVEEEEEEFDRDWNRRSSCR